MFELVVIHYYLCQQSVKIYTPTTNNFKTWYYDIIPLSYPCSK